MSRCFYASSGLLWRSSGSWGQQAQLSPWSPGWMYPAQPPSALHWPLPHLLQDQLPLDSWLPPHPPLPPCLSIQWKGWSQLQATVSLQLDSSTATAQATSSAALASPSPGNTHSLDRETPSTPRSPASPASLQGYTWDEYLNTGPTVIPSTQPQPAVPFSHLFFLKEDLHSFCHDQIMSPTSTDAFNAYLNGPMLPF